MMTDSLDLLQQVASKQQEWRALDAESKAKLLQEMLNTVQEVGFDGFTQVSKSTVSNVMGLPLDTPEGEFETVSQTLLMVAMVKGAIEKYHYAYQVRAGTAKLLRLPTRTTPDGQVVVRVAPLTNTDKFGPLSKCMGELYLDPITDVKDVKAFDFLYFESKDTSEDGVTLILGAGNQTFIMILDTLHALFQTHQVAFVKHHPLHANFDEMFRRIFAPLIERHYVGSEVDAGIKRSQQLTYSPLVSHVHMTGGKATHDDIVWGSTLPRKQPVLKASIMSELGCVMLWILVPDEYTTPQLLHQASSIVKAVYSNASANCNSPKVLVLSEAWPQREEFMSMI